MANPFVSRPDWFRIEECKLINECDLSHIRWAESGRQSGTSFQLSHKSNVFELLSFWDMICGLQSSIS